MNFHEKPNTFVSEVNLNVADLQRSLEFYQSIIGLKVLEKTEEKAVLTADGKTPLVTIEQPSVVRPKQPRRTGLYHYALLLPSRADLAKVILYMINMKYPLQGGSDHLVSEALYLADPDGNGIEIYTDRPASTWKWEGKEVVMATEPMNVEDILKEDDGKPWSGLPAGTIMGHIHLHVAEFKKTEEFYCQGLGFEIVCRYGGQALFLSTGGYHHHIGLNTWNGVGAPAPEENSVGMSSYQVVFPNEGARQEAISRLTGIGAAISEVQGSLFTKDPSGNRIELRI
ncbi:catechol 2,3-dioxygenase [Mesobacillus persicus]|uniref:Catechol 2,3-dioxygenase n=1 Tax=Mesobacillus persicus TaxID=930146 RepID=A0A1H8G7A0_9BACI|nr:VOC family protein [Mesobacillus persicus]SEN39630.1 catechol 2,3-dioxygenase [Mesobacillus persicus]